MNELKEMFPNHLPDTIERVLSSTRGIIEPTITKLLAIPPDKNPVKPTKTKNSVSSEPQLAHIFPADFLRWPKEVEYIRVFEEAQSSNSLLSQDNEMIDTDSIESPNDPSESLSTEGFYEEGATSTWESLKKKFVQAPEKYNPI